jgi:hypothetical protein
VVLRPMVAQVQQLPVLVALAVTAACSTLLLLQLLQEP